MYVKYLVQHTSQANPTSGPAYMHSMHLDEQRKHESAQSS